MKPSGTSDSALSTRVGAALFVLGAFPLALTRVPPLQDLPNHLAAAHIIAHPEIYPEYVFNGFLKTNSALTAFLQVVGRAIGFEAAARLFVLGIVGITAFVLPRFVLRFAGRDRVVVASLLGWPMVHNWFVSMGMLNFALAFPLSLLVLMALERQRAAPSLRGGVVVTALSVVTWYAHAFPLCVVGGLALLHAATRATWSLRARDARALLVPLAPTGALVVMSALAHFMKPEEGPPRPSGVVTHRLHELALNLWYDFFAGFTWLSAASLVPAVLLPIFAVRRWRESPPFFSPLASLAILLTYVELPFAASNWWYFNSRVIPFVWLAMLLRAPPRLPRAVTYLLAFCAASYSIAMAVDYVRLDRDRAAFTAGIAAVPDRARLLPLVFETKKTSELTSSLEHAWGFYVLAKNTSAPLVFAVERSYPITYRTFPPAQLIPPALDRFARNARSAEAVCAELLHEGVTSMDCDAEWRARWSAFWSEAEPRFDHVLMWAAPSGVRALVPPRYAIAFESGDLVIFARRDAP